MKEVVRPRLWSDFDGTAVRTLSKVDPRNWSKYPVPGIAGYVDFLRGVKDGQVDIAGIVSRRPNIFPRRIATVLSIARLGLDEFFLYPEQRVLAGSETRKGAFVAEQSAAATVGIIDDKPHRVGPAILQALLEVEPPESPSPRTGVKRRVAVGVVSHPKSQTYTERFIDEVRDQRAETGIKVAERTSDHAFFLHGPNYGFEVSVVQLAPYSEHAGEVFAAHLHDFTTVLPDSR